MKVLGLVFTEGISLEAWVEQGLISREKQIYEEHLKAGNFDEVIWFTYGRRDVEIRDSLVKQRLLDERIIVVPMPWYFIGKYRTQIYSYLLPYVQKKYCRQLCFIKTNQMRGAWTANKIHDIYRIPFMLRTGYTCTNLWKNKKEQETLWYKRYQLERNYKKYRKIENRLYQECDIATVSSEHDKKYICSSYQIPESKVQVVTNYIDCELFRPMPEIPKKEKRFIFVGRLNKEKNLFNIIQALGELGVGLDIYGKGELREQLGKYVQDNKWDVCFKGVVDNQELPKVYNQYDYYIIASPFEGMPKTLLEAMACGLICLGANTSGIKEVIKNKKNGYLIQDIFAESIKQAIREIDETKNEKLSKNAVRYIREKHSIEAVCNKEWSLFRQYVMPPNL